MESEILQSPETVQLTGQPALGATASGDAHGEHAEHVSEGTVFDELFGDLGDHQGLVLGNFHVADLPLMFYDQGDFHFYLTEHQMQEGGVFKMGTTHKPERVSDGQRPDLDLSITNFVFFQLLGVFLLFFFLKKVANRYKKNPNKAPRGFQNLIEIFVVYIRDEVVRPNLSERLTKRLLPYFLTTFFFILILNLFGLIPGGHIATSSIAVTGTLAIFAFFMINFTAIREIGLKGWGDALIWWCSIMARSYYGSDRNHWDVCQTLCPGSAALC